MRRAQRRMAEDIRSSVANDVQAEKSAPHCVDEEHYPLTQSGIVPRAVAPRALSKADRVLRSLRIHEALARLAAQPVALGEEQEARCAIAAALAELDELCDHRPYARVLIAIGECLIELGFPEHAEPRLRNTVALADALPDRHLGAAARRALGRARLMVGDPSCRRIFEDARAMFAELGDHEATLALDRLLRAVRIAILEAPHLRLASGE